MQIMLHVKSAPGEPSELVRHEQGKTQAYGTCERHSTKAAITYERKLAHSMT